MRHKALAELTNLGSLLTMSPDWVNAYKPGTHGLRGVTVNHFRGGFDSSLWHAVRHVVRLSVKPRSVRVWQTVQQEDERNLYKTAHMALSSNG